MLKKDLDFTLYSNTLSSDRRSASISDNVFSPLQSNESAGFRTLRVPGSKSISNRAILLACLASGRSRLQGILHSEDTDWMIQVCRQLGAKITKDDETLIIDGVDGRFKECTEELYIGNAGTCARFLCATLVRGGKGTYLLRGNSRMHERPMSPLIKILRECGAKIECLEKEGYLPLKIESRDSIEGGSIGIQADLSSQFLSALLMLAPFTKKGLDITVQGDFVSSSYVEMTSMMMKEFGVEVLSSHPHLYSVPPLSGYEACDFKIPGDASSASYFFALAAMTGQRIRIEGLKEYPVQSDLQFVNLLKLMGADVEFENDAVTVQGNPHLLGGIQVDMKDMSDLVPTLAVLALLAKGPTEIRHVAHIRGKECDRIGALCTELQKLGADIEEYYDGLRILAPAEIPKDDILIHTYDDHRIAMSFAILAKVFPNIRIENPDCVRKTYPNFFQDLG